MTGDRATKKRRIYIKHNHFISPIYFTPPDLNFIHKSCYKSKKLKYRENKKIWCVLEDKFQTLRYYQLRHIANQYIYMYLCITYMSCLLHTCIDASV